VTELSSPAARALVSVLSLLEAAFARSRASFACCSLMWCTSRRSALIRSFCSCSTRWSWCGAELRRCGGAEHVPCPWHARGGPRPPGLQTECAGRESDQRSWPNGAQERASYSLPSGGKVCICCLELLTHTTHQVFMNAGRHTAHCGGQRASVGSRSRTGEAQDADRQSLLQRGKLEARPQGFKRLAEL
jgi:hypothetical protein